MSQSCPNRFFNWINTEYVITFNFGFKIATILLSSASAISAAWNTNTLSWGSTVFFHIVSVSIIFIDLLLILFHLCNLVRMVKSIPWKLIELIIDLIYIILFIISSSIVLALGKKYEGYDFYLAAGFFGFMIVLVLVVDSIFTLIQWRSQKRSNSSNETNESEPQNNYS